MLIPIVVGFLNETLKKMGPNEAPTNISMAYIDCDLYSSTRDALEFLMPRLKHGMIIAFDDNYCWSANQLSGERRAMPRFFEDNEQWSLQLLSSSVGPLHLFVVESKRLR